MNRRILLTLAAGIAAGIASGASMNTLAADIPDTPYKKPATNTPATPTGDLTGTFDITSNYMFRGLSNSNNLPAFQGGLTYTFSSTGVYFNIWGSNVNFSDTQGNTATVEIDTIVGITNPLGEHFSYDISLDRYNYPKSSSSYSELIANAKWYFLKAQVSFSSNVYGVHHNGTYYNLGFTYDVPPPWLLQIENINVSGGIGHYSMQRSGGLSSYNDYNLNLNKTLGNYILTLGWTDTSNSHFNLPNDPTPATRGNHFFAQVLANF